MNAGKYCWKKTLLMQLLFALYIVCIVVIFSFYLCFCAINGCHPPVCYFFVKYINSGERDTEELLCKSTEEKVMCRVVVLSRTVVFEYINFFKVILNPKRHYHIPLPLFSGDSASFKTCWINKNELYMLV